MQGLVLSPPFSQEVVCSLGLMACCSDCSSIHTLVCSDCSDSVTPPLALILVLIVISPILSLLLWLILIESRHILGLLYGLVS